MKNDVNAMKIFYKVSDAEGAVPGLWLLLTSCLNKFSSGSQSAVICYRMRIAIAAFRMSLNNATRYRIGIRDKHGAKVQKYGVFRTPI